MGFFASLRSFLPIALGFIAWPVFAADMQIDLKTKAVSRADVEKAIEVFRKACPRLGATWWPEFSEVKAEAVDYTPHEKLGWKTMINLALRIPETTNRIIPAFDNQAGVVRGHVLHYQIGGGREPGIWALKRVSQIACPMVPFKDVGEAFMAVPGLSFLK